MISNIDNNNDYINNIQDNNNNNKKEIKYYNQDNIISNPIIDYQRFFSVRNLTLEFQDSIRAQAFFSSDQLSNLGTGEPCPDLFPLEDMKFRIKNFDDEIVLNKDDIHYIQSYSKIPGHPKLIEWLIKLQKETHHLQNDNRVGREWKVIITHGAQGALDCIFKAIFDRNDSLIVESFTYGGVFGFCDPHGVNYVGIDMDDYGIIPDHLDRELKNWNLTHKGLNFPKAIYLIPNAQNPTGAQYDLQRKIEIYNICSRYNLLIIEDDPNIFLKLEGKQDSIGRYIGEPSFLSMDTDKRVIRIDTFSKLFASYRFGFITTWNELYTPIAAEIGNTLIHTSNLTQILIYKMLDIWQLNGFYLYVKRNQQIIIQKREYMKSMFDKYLNGLVEYNNPKGGHYYWVKLLGVDCSNSFITTYLLPNKILLNMGINFSSIQNHKTPYCRFTYTLISNNQIEECFKIIQSSLIKYKNDNNK